MATHTRKKINGKTGLLTHDMITKPISELTKDEFQIIRKVLATSENDEFLTEIDEIRISH